MKPTKETVGRGCVADSALNVSISDADVCVSGISAGKVTLISVPTPSSLQTSTLPPTFSDVTILLTIARPRPVPVCRGFSWEKGWKSWFCQIKNYIREVTMAIGIDPTFRKFWLMP